MNENERLIYNIVGDCVKKFPRASFDQQKDLKQDGAEAIIKAWENYDPEKGAENNYFGTVASNAMTNKWVEMNSHFKVNSRVRRLMSKIVSIPGIVTENDALENEWLREETRKIHRISGDDAVDRRICEAIRLLAGVTVLSYSDEQLAYTGQRVYGTEEMEGMITRTTPIVKASIMPILDPIFKTLQARQRKILEKEIMGQSPSEIADQMPISSLEVLNLRQKALAEIQMFPQQIEVYKIMHQGYSSVRSIYRILLKSGFSKEEILENVTNIRTTGVSMKIAWWIVFFQQIGDTRQYYEFIDTYSK